VQALSLTVSFKEAPKEASFLGTKGDRFLYFSYAFQEIITVPIILKNCLTFNPSGNNVMKRSWRIYA
jgi:hypothetical protein